ncbi:MAG: DUF4382 domain-containing protein [Bacteroidota bacterium]
MKKILSVLLLFVLGLGISSCTKDKETEGSVQTGRFELNMTDAPGAYEAVNIDIQGVEVKTSGGSTLMLNVTPGIYNLLNYANGVDTLIASADIPVTTISQVRLILGSNNTLVENGVTYNLSTPSAQQSGLKLNVHAEIEPGITYHMLIDFDAERSIVETGNGSYSLKPVIRVIATALNGSIHGIVSPSLALPATVWAIRGSDTVSTTTGNNGEFLFQGMVAGSYSVILEPQLPYLNDTLLNVNVSTGVMTELGTIIL